MKFIEIINEMNFNEINKKLNNYQIVTLRKIIKKKLNELLKVIIKKKKKIKQYY